MMAHLKTFLFLACCFALGMGIATAVVRRHAHHADDPGVSRESGGAPALRGFHVPLEDATNSALDRVAALHGSAVALSCPAGRAAGPDLAQTVAHAHGLGLKVLLLPAPVFSKGDPYPATLAKIGAQAQAARVDVLCISWLNSDPDPAYWHNQASALRAVFKGQLIWAATPRVLTRLDFLDCGDLIGAIGPIEPAPRLPHASDEVDLHALQVAWECVLDPLESLAVKSGQHLILLNMDVPETIRARLPTPGARPAPARNPELQLLAFQALLAETRGREAMPGLLLPLPEKAISGPYVARLAAGVEAQWSAAGHGQMVKVEGELSPSGESRDPG